MMMNVIHCYIELWFGFPAVIVLSEGSLKNIACLSAIFAFQRTVHTLSNYYLSLFDWSRKLMNYVLIMDKPGFPSYSDHDM